MSAALSMVAVRDIHTRLARVLGPENAQKVTSETLYRAGLQEIRTPTDLLLFAKELEARGGLYEVVGRALKTQALLRGATS